jgi:hypothetical protein
MATKLEDDSLAPSSHGARERRASASASESGAPWHLWQLALARVERYVRSFRTRSVFPAPPNMAFDSRTNEWPATFTYVNCEILVLSDRCHGDGVGGAKCD